VAYRRAHKEEIKAWQAANYTAYYAAHKEEIKANVAAYRAANQEKIMACRVRHFAAHKEEINALARERYGTRYIITSVYHHHRCIFKGRTRERTYKNMPFFDAWNPDKGGSFRVGADWIRDNLGERPDKASSLHVIPDTGLGFVPGNLVWATKQTQGAEQAHLILPIRNARIKTLEEMFSPQIEIQKFYRAFQEETAKTFLENSQAVVQSS
jgi:hypothetical protein